MLDTSTLLNHLTTRSSLRFLLRDLQRIATDYHQHEIPLPTITAMSLEGGAQRGKVYSSAIEALEMLGIIEDLELVVGTSVGAIVAFIIGLGFDANQLKEIAHNLNFTDVLDARKTKMGNWWAGTWAHKVISLAGRTEFMHNGKIFEHWASYYVEAILGSAEASFADLHEKVISGEDPSLKDLIFTAVDAKNDAVQEFSFKKTPDVRIVDALKASISLPGVLPMRVVRNKDGSEFGKFVDGGVRLNNPINILDQSCYTKANYPLQTNERSAGVAVNPSGLGLSLAWMASLDEGVTPLSPSIRKEMNDFKAENAMRVAAQERSLFAWKWLKEKVSKITKIISFYKQKYWKFYDPSDIIRHVLHYNTGLVTTTREDSVAKLQAHVPNAIQLWNLDILPHELNFSPKQRDRADIVGKETANNWWDKWHKPSEVYQGQYVELLSDYAIDKLPGLLIAFEKELKKYQNPYLKVRGYNAETKNVRLIHLAKQINQVLASTANPLEALKEGYDEAANLKKTKADNIAKNKYKRRCYEQADAGLRLIEAIKSSDCVKIKRAYHSQLGAGLSFLITPLPGLNKNAIQFALDQESSASLKTILKLADNSINQFIQHGNRPRFTSVEQLIKYACDPEDLSKIVRKGSADFVACIKRYFPHWLQFTISNHLAFLNPPQACLLPQRAQAKEIAPLQKAAGSISITVAEGNKLTAKHKARISNRTHNGLSNRPHHS